MLGCSIGADPEHDSVLRGDRVVRIAKAARLLIAAGCVVFRVKVQHHRLTPKLVERNLAATVRGCGEVWRGVALVYF